MKHAGLPLVLALALFAQDRPPITRATFAPLEKEFDRRVERPIENPLFLLGTTRGLYIAGFGSVFTAELNLVTGPTISPFNPSLTKQELAQLKLTKMKRLPHLRQIMRETMYDSAKSLDNVPADEDIVLGVTLFHYHWEDSAGLPGQIVMRASRQKLLETKRDRLALENAIHVQEY